MINILRKFKITELVLEEAEEEMRVVRVEGCRDEYVTRIFILLFYQFVTATTQLTP